MCALEYGRSRIHGDQDVEAREEARMGVSRWTEVVLSSD